MSDQPLSKKGEAALELARQGFRVFPLRVNQKEPAIAGWQTHATSDEPIVGKFWSKYPNCNIGIATGGDLFVIDVDVKSGKPGAESLKDLETFYDLPGSLRVTTPSGGIHAYLRKDAALCLASNADKVIDHPGLDIRAEGGYVVAPGSTIDGKAYTSNEAQILPAPECIFPLLRKPLEQRNDVPVTELDQPHNIERARAWLIDLAPEAVEGAGGDQTTYSVAAELRQLGVSEATALDLMLEHWNEQKASPPWLPDDLAKKVSNAFQYGQGAAGAKTPDADFGATDIDTGKLSSGTDTGTTSDRNDTAKGNVVILPRPYKWIDPAHLPRRQWLYGTHLARKYVSGTIAPSGLGKSSLVLAEALAMASGKPILGVPVERPLNVWYWNLEDPYDELLLRIAAIAHFYGLAPEDFERRLFVESGRDRGLRVAVNGPNGAHIVQPVVNGLIEGMCAREIDVLSVDPFVSAHMVSENDNMAIDAVAKEFGRVADATNAAIELVHHTRKTYGQNSETTAESSRGGVALVGALRDVRVLNRMGKEEAAKGGIDNERQFFRVHSDKSNMAPQSDRADWYKIENVEIANGDQVGVVTHWNWPDPFEDITLDHVRKVQRAIGERALRESVQAADWVGKVVAEALLLDLDNPSDKEQVKALLKHWIAQGWLRQETWTDEKGKERPVVKVGKLLHAGEFDEAA